MSPWRREGRRRRRPAAGIIGDPPTAAARKFLRFFIDEPARVLLAYKAGASQLPEWLQSFVPTGMQVEVSQWRSKMAFPVYRKDFPPGKVMLGDNHAPPYAGDANMNYLVVVRQLHKHPGGMHERNWGLGR